MYVQHQISIFSLSFISFFPRIYFHVGDIVSSVKVGILAHLGGYFAMLSLWGLLPTPLPALLYIHPVIF